MLILERESLTRHHLPGRVIQKAVGKDSASTSGKMTMGFARYSAASGPMEPHQHAEEIVYIVDAKAGWVRAGSEKDELGQPIPLETGYHPTYPGTRMARLRVRRRGTRRHHFLLWTGGQYSPGGD